MNIATRVECPVCGRMTLVRADGRMREHQRPAPTGKRRPLYLPPCPAGGLVEQAARDLVRVGALR